MVKLRFTPEEIDGFEVNRCYRGKVQCQENDELYRALEITHRIFNEKVAQVCRLIFKVLNDKSNPEFARLTRWAIENITPAGQCSTHFANPFTLQESRANPTHSAYNRDESMRELFYRCKERGDRWYDRQDVFGDLIQGRSGGSGMVAEVNQAAIEKISGYLSLMKNWREGNATPVAMLDEDQFVKKLVKFIKEYREILAENWQKEIDRDSTDKDTELYEILLYAKKSEQESLLRDIYRNRLEYGWLLEELEGLYRSYSNEALGKKDWLKQKKHFEQVNTSFYKEYTQLLEEYCQVFKNQEETVSPNNLPARWFRDPNFLSLLNQKGAAVWPGFISPLANADFKEEWEKLREAADLPEKPWDSRKGRDLYVSTLRDLNPALFNATGWFKVFERYNKLQHFARPPQFRYPDAVKHPEWINFSEGGCFKYRTPKVIGSARLEITVNLVDPDNPGNWKSYCLEVALDSRLKTLRDRQLIEEPDGRWVKTLDGQRIFDWRQDDDGNPLYKTDYYYPWVDNEGEVRWIQIHGGNLISRNGAFYLHFRYTYKTPKKPKLKNEASGGAFAYLPGTRLLGVDQGQKDDAVVTIMELTEDGQFRQVPFEPFVFKRHKAPKPRRDGKAPGKVFYQWIKLPGGMSFRALTHAENKRSQRRKAVKGKESAYFRARELEGKPLPSMGKTKGRYLTRGQVFDKKLKNYIEHCRELHYKTLAGVLFKIAKENNCQGIVMENLNSYKVTLKQDRFQNRGLMTWAMQKKTAFLETLCDSGQIILLSKSAAYTSQTCNHCESYGVRFNFPTKSEWDRYKRNGTVPVSAGDMPYPVVIAGGDWFLCSNPACCGKKKPHDADSRYMIQADANAAKNLLIRAFRKDGWGMKVSDKDERKRIQGELQEWLKNRYAK